MKICKVVLLCIIMILIIILSCCIQLTSLNQEKSEGICRKADTIDADVLFNDMLEKLTDNSIEYKVLKKAMNEMAIFNGIMDINVDLVEDSNDVLYVLTTDTFGVIENRNWVDKYSFIQGFYPMSYKAKELNQEVIIDYSISVYKEKIFDGFKEWNENIRYNEFSIEVGEYLAFQFYKTSVNPFDGVNNKEVLTVFLEKGTEETQDLHIYIWIQQCLSFVNQVAVMPSIMYFEAYEVKSETHD